jgi:uncharacterized protein (TIGR03382 family)
MRNVIAVGIGVVVAVAVAAPPAQACSQLLPSFFDDLAPFENQHVPTNADLVVIGATFDVPAAGVLTGPDGVAAEVAWVVEEQLVRLDITDLLPGEYSLDFNGSGLRTVAFVVDDRLDTDAPAAPDLVDVVETPARQPGPLDWLFGVPDCGYSGGDDVAYALVDGSPVAYADRIRVAGAGTVDVQLVDFAGNVSSAVSGSDDRGAGGCSSTSASSGLWALALLLLVRRRR